jgi:hypothetical protein
MPYPYLGEHPYIDGRDGKDPTHVSVHPRRAEQRHTRQQVLYLYLEGDRQLLKGTRVRAKAGRCCWKCAP